MIIFLYTIIFGVFLNECKAAFNIDDFQYKGDPIRFACITKDSQREFYMTHVNGSVPSALVQELDNGRGLSLLFYAISKADIPMGGLFRSYASEWYKASGNNICIVTYSYATNSKKSSKIDAIVKEMVKTRRLEYVAKMARDLVWGVREKCKTSKKSQCLKHLSQVDVTGFGFGAHIAGRTCEYLNQKTGEKVRILLALNPIKTPFFGPKIHNSIRRNDANYVQVIHTCKRMGIWDQIGDVDIYVNYNGVEELGSLNNKHRIAFFIHLATSTKRLFIAAGGIVGTMQVGDEKIYNLEMIKKECVVGVYSERKEDQIGKKFIFYLRNRVDDFWAAIDKYGKAEFLLGSQDDEQDDLDTDECIVCYENKKNVLFLPCKHQHVCVECWEKLKNERRCPVCRDYISRSVIVHL